MRDSFVVPTGEYGGSFAGPYGMLQRESDAGPGFASGTTADGIDHHHYGPAAGCEDAVHFFWSARFFDSETGQILAHGNKKSFRVSHTLNVAEDEPKESRRVVR